MASTEGGEQVEATFVCNDITIKGMSQNEVNSTTTTTTQVDTTNTQTNTVTNTETNSETNTNNVQ